MATGECVHPSRDLSAVVNINETPRFLPDAPIRPKMREAITDGLDGEQSSFNFMMFVFAQLIPCRHGGLNLLSIELWVERNCL